MAQAVGIGLAAGGARYYLTHPRRVVAPLPRDLARVSEEVFLRATDGTTLHATWLPGRAPQGEPSCDRTIIHYHGFNGSGGLLLARASEPLTAWPLVFPAMEAGYNVLLVDMRGHGRSGGPWETTGVLAADDLVRWTCWLRESRDQLWLGLWGHSFGAAVGLALATRAVCGGLDAMVLDSPPLSPLGLYSGLVGKPVYWLLQPVLLQLGHDRLPELLSTSEVSVPILLIHGEADTHVPAWHTRQAYELLWRSEDPERISLWVVPGADHLESLEVATETYVEKSIAWFNRWFGG